VELEPSFSRNADVCLFVSLEDMPEWTNPGQHLPSDAAVLHPPSLSTMVANYSQPWPRPEKLKVQYFCLTDMAWTKRPEFDNEGAWCEYPAEDGFACWEMLPTIDGTNYLGFFPKFAFRYDAEGNRVDD
jgi:hypothetical protein